MKWKVCGMRYTENISQILEQKPDYLGLIFYPPSKRYVGDLEPDFIPEMNGVERVGVFVDEELDKLKSIIERYKLDLAQVHGKESPEFCREIKDSGTRVIKAFSIPVNDAFDFASLEAYLNSVDFFLFDTKGKLPGGNGYKFNWEVLHDYKMDKPFFLSGGIGLDELEDLKNFSHPQWYAIDVNSRFELEPGLKDVNRIIELTKEFEL